MLVMMMVSMIMIMVVIVFVFMMVMVMVMVMGQMNIELRSRDPRFFLARNMDVITIHVQFLQFMLELMPVHAQIQQRTEKHIATDAAEDIEVKGFHESRKHETFNNQHSTFNSQ